MASNNNLNDVFNDIATAINNKGVSGKMKPTEMAEKIAEIPSGSTGETIYICKEIIMPKIEITVDSEVWT